MKSVLTIRRAGVIATALATLALLASSGTAGAATWGVAYPPFQTLSNVPFAPLQAVAPISATNVWAVGRDDGSMLAGNWNGTAWSSVPVTSAPCSVFESDCQLTGVSGDSASDVIAVGNGILNTYPTWTASALAFQWQGSAWQPMTLPSGLSYDAMEHVQAFSPTDTWAVGVGTSGSSTVAAALNWNGKTWTQVATPISTTNDLAINAISGSSASDIWVVGQTATAGYRNRQFTSVAMHYNGSAWTQVTLPDSSGLLDVATLSPTDAWALAADGSVLNWNGSAWTVVTQLAEGNTVLAALSATDIWVGGVVSLTHYNGTTWSSAPIPSGISTLTGGGSLTSGHVWFTGDYVTSAGVTEPAVLSTSGG
jgi:hypothetical protein